MSARLIRLLRKRPMSFNLHFDDSPTAFNESLGRYGDEYRDLMASWCAERTRLASAPTIDNPSDDPTTTPSNDGKKEE